MWCDGEWQAWGELHKSTEMADVSIKAHMPFQEAKDRASNKGKGKGPDWGPERRMDMVSPVTGLR